MSVVDRAIRPHVGMPPTACEPNKRGGSGNSPSVGRFDEHNPFIHSFGIVKTGCMSSDPRPRGPARVRSRASTFVRRHPLWVLLIVALAAMSTTTGALSVGAWPIHVLSQQGGGATDIEIDSHGNLHVVFTAPSPDSPGGYGSLYYATNSRGGWSVSLLDDGYEVEDVALAKGPDDEMHVAYTAWIQEGTRLGPPTVRYLSIGGDNAAREVVDAFGFHPSIAVDSAGTVHIMYAQLSDSFALMHAIHTGGSWTYETAVPSGGGYGAVYSAIAVDPHGVIRATFTASSDDYGYATNEGGSWQYEWLVRDGSSQSRVPIAVDGRGRIHVAYSGCRDSCDPARVIHGVKDAGSWTYETVGTRSILDPAFVDLAVDPAGTPHVLFYDHPGGSMVHVEKTADGWRSSVVDRGTMAIAGGSIALSPEKEVAIAYDRMDDEPASGSIRVATSGVDFRNVLDFLWGILPVLAIEFAIFCTVGLGLWHRARRSRGTHPIRV